MGAWWQSTYFRLFGLLLSPLPIAAIILYGYLWGRCAALGVPSEFIHLEFTSFAQTPYVSALLLGAFLPAAALIPAESFRGMNESHPFARFTISIACVWTLTMLINPDIGWWGRPTVISLVLFAALYSRAIVRSLLIGIVRLRVKSFAFADTSFARWVGKYAKVLGQQDLLDQIRPVYLYGISIALFLMGLAYSFGFTSARSEKVFAVLEDSATPR